ncbi:MAG TPA: hypothetical protein VFL98_01165 [Candidatus Paceibacterota bacterium]|nr:hypothetical protein [Candidatus Paceibacterota bacterium]
MPLLTAIIIAIAGIYALYGVVLAYHWFRFSTSTGIAVASAAIYYAAGLALSLMALAAAALL